MTFNEYLRLVQQTHISRRTWRLGQTYFNVLSEVNSNLANAIKGTVDDPFYCSNRIGGFLTVICELWED